MPNAIRGIQRNRSDSNQNPQTDWEAREWIFSEKMQNIQAPAVRNIAITESFDYRIFYLIKSCDIQILDKEN